MRLWTAQVEDLSELEEVVALIKEHEAPVSTSIFNVALLT